MHVPCRRTATAAATFALGAALTLSLTTTASAAPYVPPTPEDLSAQTWTEAFDALVVKMSREYAFTAWKSIDWQALRSEYRPKVAKAQAANDDVAYLLALRDFTHELQDGHVQIRSATGEFESQVRKQLAGGGFGLIASRLDDGRVTATWVQRGGPAWKAGVRTGAVISRWNGLPIDTALARTSTALGPAQPTRARVKYERLRFLVRDKVGAKRSLAFRNPGQQRKRATITAVDDKLKTLNMTDASSVFSKGWPTDMVESKILPGNVGYLRILAEIDLPASLPGDHTPTLKQVRTAMAQFRARKVSKLVVDIRGNGGGMDQMVADIMTSFYSRKSFYEYQNWIVPSTGKFEIWKTNEITGAYVKRDAGIWIEPGTRPFRGQVAVLVDNGCISSCEGIALGLSRLPNATLVGFYGTNGSFGMVGDGALMPGGQVITWPFGQSLDVSKRVQLDSRNGVGGVSPDVRVPHTLSNVGRAYRGSDVVLEYGLRTFASTAK